MLKKFVPLYSNSSPSQNPYEVRTYLGDNGKAPEWKVKLCDTDRKCIPPTSTISKVLTIEDELRRLAAKAKCSRFQSPFKKKCEYIDTFTACVVPQRTPKELRKHAVMREKYIATQYELMRRIHDASAVRPDGPDFIQLNSPIGSEEEEEAAEEEVEGEEEEEGEGKKPVKPKQASPSCSMDLIYAPPKKLLELKRPKSGMFHNQTEPPEYDEDDLPYSTYNPRLIQEQFDQQGLPRIDIIEGRDPNDLWTWNLGIQKRESELDRHLLKASIAKFDCNNIELALFNIPNDLDKTFTAEIVFGNESVLPETPKKRSRSYFKRPQEIACIFVAFVESYRLNPDFWTAETMDAIFVAADKLIKKSETLNYKATEMDFDIIHQLPDKQATVGLKVHYTGPLHSEPNIYKVLSLYFSKYNACLLCSPNLYLLIWKRCSHSFYIFDPNGRNELCLRDFEEGKCSLMATRYVEHLVHLIVNFSQSNLEDEFNLYEIYLINYGKITNPMQNKPFPKPWHRIWAVVNENYAIIPAANNGLQQPITGNENNESMIISLMALLYSDIERACLWRMEVIDDLIKFGKAYHKALVKKLKLKKNQHLNIADLPEVILMGVFKATLKKRPFLYTGHVADCRNFLDSQLILSIKELFCGKWESALLQIDNSFIALWRDVEFFYVFDPFRRGKAGQVLDPEDYLTKGVGCLQMHANFESFCRILYMNAIKMRRGGKFFLHGTNVGCIKPIIKLMNAKNKYTRLRLTFPKYNDYEVETKKAKKNKKGKVERKYSIQSIPEEDLIPPFEDMDVVDAALEEILCDIFTAMEEPLPDRDRLYKQAEQVLLQSDKPYLESLRYKLKHGEDYDNIYAAFRTYPEPPPQPMTLEEEMLVPSNFESLPDGTWVIFGSSQLPVVDDELGKVAGLLSCLVTAATAQKYKISTWNTNLIEYALESANGFDEQYQSYEYLLTGILGKKLPRIGIGHNTYDIDVQKVIKSASTKSLRQTLLESLMNYNRLLMICQRFSCLILKRYNFLYMFIGFPCNSVGYRKFGSGPGCMLRFIELDSLIRRIEFGCNPQGCEVSNYVVVALKVHDVTDEPPQMFREWPESEQEAMYKKELAEKQRQEKSRNEKMRFLDDELRKEHERIQKFLEAKGKHAEACKPPKRKRTCPKRRRYQRAMDLDFEDEMEDEYYENYEEEFEEEVEEEIELKHKPGKKLKRERIHRFKPRPILYGYRMREKDCLYKIQGSTALEGREESQLDMIKKCFFASTLAILYAILRPLNQWTSQRVDRVIENGNVIASKVANMNTAFERMIKHIKVDDYEFDVWAKTFEPTGVYGALVDRKIEKAMQARKYLLLQTANCTYAIYHDDLYHLFDPYGSMEVVEDEAEEEEADEEEDEGGKKKKKKCTKKFKRYGERNTASWILFADVESMIDYITKRSTNREWSLDNEYKFHVVDIVRYKKAARSTRILQLLTDLSVPMECKITQHGEDESTICSHNETLSWLDVENCLPVWSRMNRRNTSGRYRNLAVTKLKKYDIEIDGRLWSLWGNLHPQAPVFEAASRGKQSLACCVLACCAARIYPLTDWSAQLLDSIVISGDRYHRESLANIKQPDYEFSAEDLNLECTLENIKFVVHLEHVAFGQLYYVPTYTKMNLAEGLMYFFGHFQFGILQCSRRALAIGRTMGHDGGYFMYDCQSRDHPLFPKGQGASYLLRTKHLQVLLYCIVVTLNIPYYNVQFTLHKVEMLREGASVEEEEEEEEGEEEEDAYNEPN